MNLQKKSGFTFIEVTVTIFIISLLSTIGFVSYKGYTQGVKNSSKIVTITRINDGLSTVKIQGNKLPTPDNNQIIKKGLGILNAGIVGGSVVKKIGMDKIPLDPETGVQYSYVTQGKTYEIGTAISRSSNVGYVEKAYAGNLEDQKAFLMGNYNGYFVKYSSGGKIYYVSSPSITLTNINNTITPGISSTGIVMNNGTNFPYTYSGLTNIKTNTTAFTPNYLYSGTGCGPQDYEDILGFYETLADSHKNNFDQKIAALGKINNDIDKIDFTLNLINSMGVCETPQPKIPDIFPKKCGGKDGTFEGYGSGETLGSNCMLSSTGSTWIIENGGGNGGSKGIRNINSSINNNINYKVSSNKPFKLAFDYKGITSVSWGKRYFRINGFDYIVNNVSDTSFKTYKTPLLPPGEYTFSFGTEIWNAQTTLYVDNIKIECLGGGGSCGWANTSFETGSVSPWETFSFGGMNNIPWIETSDASEGNQAITTPIFPSGRKNIELTKNINLYTSGKIEFDYKGSLDVESSIEVSINDIIYLIHTPTGPSFSTYSTFTSPLLPAGNYKVKWKIYGGRNGYTRFYLDSFRVSCIGGGTLCGRTSGTLEKGDTEPWNIFSFTGTIKLPWNQTNDSNQGLYAIVSPDIIDSRKLSYIEKNITLTGSNYISFDYKGYADIEGSIEFYIDNTLYLNHIPTGPSFSTYSTFTSPLLPPGTYKLKWRINSGRNSKSKLYIDNLRLTP